MSQYWFSLGFLSQNYFWKLSTFRGYKGIYSSACEECEKLVFIQTGHSSNSVSWVERVAGLSCELTAWPDCTFCHVVLQLSWPFNSPACFTHVPFWRLASREIQSWDSFELYTSWVFFTLSHTLPLHKSHLNTGYLIAILQANLAWNKANTWLNKFNLTISPFGYFMTKP